jgi:hypothetical protein
MLTDIRSRALLVLSLGLVPVGSSLHGQAATPVPERVTDGTIEASYHLQTLKRNELGQYEMTGTLRGERRGEAIVAFAFDSGSSGVSGHALVLAPRSGERREGMADSRLRRRRWTVRPRSPGERIDVLT